MDTNSTSTSNETVDLLPKHRRLDSLDTLRGIAIVIMVFVNAGGFPYFSTNHVPWDSRDAPALHLADYACPIFVFCIGTSMSVSATSGSAASRSKKQSLLHAVTRTLKMIVIGFFLKNGSFQSFGNGVLDMRSVRMVSVLGRLGWSYFFVAVIMIFANTQSRRSLPTTTTTTPTTTTTTTTYQSVNIQDDAELTLLHAQPKRNMTAISTVVPEVTRFWKVWVVVSVVLVVYMSLTFAYPVPGCPAGYLGPGGIADGGRYYNCTGGFMGYFDTKMLGGSHMDAHGIHGEFCSSKYNCPGPFDANGFFGCLPTIFHIMLGFTVGRVLMDNRDRPRFALKKILLWALLWTTVGLVLDRTKTIRFSKNMWSLSFVLGMSGVTSVLLAGLFVLIDSGSPSIAAAHRVGLQGKWKMQGGLFRTTGQNSIALYVISESVIPILRIFCWSKEHGDPGPTCLYGADVALNNGGGADKAGTDNTLLGVIYRALWRLVGGRVSELTTPAPEVCTAGMYPGSWDECGKYYSVVLVWSIFNVVIILLIGWLLSRHKIFIKL